MRLGKHLRAFWTSCIIAVATGGIAPDAQAATLVDVNGEKGHAFLVQHRGNCYAVLPHHVAEGQNLSLVSALPQTMGIGTVFWRDPQIDLAIAYVEGELARSCDLNWATLERSVGTLLQQQGSGALARINWGGEIVDRAEGVVIDADANTFIVNTTEAWSDAEVEGGVSGALFYKDRVPVGMALSALTNRSARFLRMDRIYGLLNPVLVGGAAAHPAQSGIASDANGPGFRVTGQAVEIDGVLQGVTGTLQWPWTGAPVEIELTFSNTAPIPIRQITLISKPTVPGGAAAPQRILVELDRGMPGAPFWRPISSDDMSPAGVLKIPTGGSRARRMKLRIQSIWGAANAVHIDRIELE